MEGGRRWPVRCLRFRISFCFFLQFAQVAVVGMEMLKCRRHVKYEVWLKAPITWEWVFLLAESGPRKLIWRKLCQRLLPFLGQKWFEGVNSKKVSVLAANGLWNIIWSKLCQRLVPFSGQNMVWVGEFKDCFSFGSKWIVESHLN